MSISIQTKRATVVSPINMSGLLDDSLLTGGSVNIAPEDISAVYLKSFNFNIPQNSNIKGIAISGRYGIAINGTPDANIYATATIQNSGAAGYNTTDSSFANTDQVVAGQNFFIGGEGEFFGMPSQMRTVSAINSGNLQMDISISNGNLIADIDFSLYDIVLYVYYEPIPVFYKTSSVSRIGCGVIKS